MTLNRAYQMLAAFYTLLIVVGVIAILAGGGTAIALAHLVAGALVVTGLWGYILERGFMNPRMWRPLAVVLGVASLAQLYVVLTVSVSGAMMTWMLTSTVFSLLMVVILYRYGNRDQELWATPEEREGGRALDDMLAERGRVEAEKHEADRQASVEVVKTGSEYRASVTRRREGQEERFSESFRCPSTMVFFLEKFAGISVGDFHPPHSDTPA
ncbi:DUF308 domain-containing protein [Halomonas urumqiensis]|uniref:Uncharacterized protein n=1 Tax=Halomonas urumqiensis TaxID=1684789 RepID=A0A2N7UKN6_9GAMM|nr:DUF308 domain-containing protein [Halomonas urumqiensis]PMR80959.1 hypothetical protein C1H70_07145 [Halomonas urumqiensis]PTB02937.1 DUF308 domain-containing protein [Halomonas urumqiensis]